MQMLIQQIHTGWPENKQETPTEIREYHASRQELVEQEGIVYKGHNILIPPRLRSETLRKLHTSHQGIEKTKRLARQCIFWPGMNSQIEDTVSKCSTCLQHRNANHREPLQPHQLPSRPWQRVATDLFDWKGRTHLIVVDYYSRYPEVAELRDTRAKTVIAKTKSFFSRHGIPEEVVSDNGPQYSAREYKEFAEDYGFVHTTISPRYPQSGGLHEKAVQTVEQLLQKCSESNQDPYLALLDYRNTPIEGVSPAQALMSRRLRTTLPISQRKLNPSVISPTEFAAERQKSQTTQKKYYDRTASPLPPLARGDVVRMKKDPKAEWKPAIVIAKHDTPRSYVVKTEDGAEYRRNRKHLMKTREEHPVPPLDMEEPVATPTQEPAAREPPDKVTPPSSDMPNSSGLRVSRFGRTIKPNPKYKD